MGLGRLLVGYCAVELIAFFWWRPGGEKASTCGDIVTGRCMCTPDADKTSLEFELN